ncbi:MAG: ABC transporter permease [Burkholderiales bacterium]|jgi:lipoprotein-releasing system permease protein|nr:ABC transporter permease [Burkholderiales bacterium]MCA3162158.1 ABC transporter permease [Burkholderiales bacterium]MCA3163258.1 ABC transporter permease [Burkholderiales bacterium]MCA3165986.1 ABC transporter permease [Burkholderiales bacterium]MCA3171110.1 ABC transporter permease [Burkholderiales bacterium]
MPFEWLLALRFLREGRMQSILILAGVTGGVAVIIFLTQLINQLQSAIIDRVLGSQAHIVIRPTEDVTRRALDADQTSAQIQPRAQRLRSVDQWENIAQLASQTAGVVAVSPVVSGAGFALRGGASKSVAIMGVEAEAYQRVVKMPTYMVQGRFEVSGTNTLIGVELAKDLGVGVGDKIRVITATGFEARRDETLTITGLFDMGNKDLNRRWVFTTLKVAQNLLDLPGGVSNIDLTVTDLFGADKIAQQLKAQTGLNVESWMQTNSSLLNALYNQSVSNNLIRTFVILIVALGISSVLVVSVVQKQKEIGILRAMGTGQRRIMAVFLLQGGIVGFFGSVLGSGLSYSLLFIFSRIYRSPDGSQLFNPKLDPKLVLMAWAIALVVGVLAAAIPARRAAQMDPVQAIRA